jgi:4-hydroxybenzoate polyprenyltransferase
MILGLGLALAPIGAYLAVSGEFNVTPILFSLAVLFWVSGFDIIYSLQDERFDRSQKLHSFPVLLGGKKALNLSKILHLLVILFLCQIPNYFNFGNIYWLGLLIFSALLIYQHTLVKYNNLSNINLAFFTLNGIASIIFGIFVIVDLLLNLKI